MRLYNELRKRPKLFAGLVFIFLSFVLYGNTLANGFVFDDRVIIRDRGELKDVSHIPKLLFEPYHSSGYDADAYRPLTMISYALNYVLLGQDARGFHLVNILLYALAAYAGFLFLWRLTGGFGLSFTAGLIFIFLPIHTEAVAGLVGRAEILSMFFSFFGFWVLLKGKEEDFPSATLTFSRQFKAALLFLLALLSKESALGIIPLYLVIIEADFAGKEGFLKKLAALFKKYWTDFAYLFGAFFLYLLMRVSTLENLAATRATVVENPLKFASPIERIITAVKILGMYIVRIIYPAGNLSSDYSFNQIPASANIFDPLFALGAITLASAFFIIAAVFFKNSGGRCRIAAYAAGIFMFFYLPVSNIVFPIGTIMAERLMFIPSLGICLLTALLIRYFLKRFSAGAVIYGLYFTLAGLVIFYGRAAIIRNLDWKSEKALFQSAAELSPRSVLSRSNNGAMHLIDNDLERAEKEIKAAQEIYDNYGYNLNNLGLLFLRKNRLEEARRQFVDTIIRHPDYAEPIDNLGLVYYLEGRYESAKKFWIIVYGEDKASIKLAAGFQDNIIDLLKRGERKEAGELAARAGDLIENKRYLAPIKEMMATD
ncbi:MAG: hypothetical protein WC745_05335 [Patescibacteria group bacterium]